MMSRALRRVALIAATSMFAAMPAPAGASPTVKLKATLHPDRLGANTTMSVSFRVGSSGDAQPPALRRFAVLLPPELGLATSTLGVATCASQALALEGPAACPPDAAMGGGSAVAEATFGPELIRETAPISIFMGEPTGGQTSMLYYFDGSGPIIAPLVFPSEFFGLANSARSELATVIPAVGGLPGTANVSITSLRVRIGPDDLTYYRRVGRRRVAYRPVGMAVPAVCPRHGFVFSGYFSFEDGSNVRASSTVRCPRR